MPHGHLSELLDLDAEVLHEYYHDVITWLTALLPDRPHLIDLGAGTGAGTFAFARAIPAARITAVDVDEDMVARLRERAAAFGDRIRVTHADLDGDWPALDTADLVWASASLHHLADPDAALARVRDLLRPGGYVAAVEFTTSPSFLTGTADAALEARVLDAMAARRHHEGMHIDDRWADRLARAGFAVEAERRFDIVQTPPRSPAAGRYAEMSYRHARHGLEGTLSEADLRAVERVADGVADRDDLELRASRTVYLGRKP